MKKTILLICLMFVIVFSIGVSALDNTNLAHRYEYSSNALDSAGSINGDLVNSPSFISGIDGLAIEFDGTSSYMNFSNNVFDTVLNATHTLSMWVNPYSILTATDYIFDSEDRNALIYISNTGDRFYYQVYDDGAVTHTIFSYEITEFNKWYHITTRWNGTNISMFIDGVKQDSEKETLSIGTVLKSRKSSFGAIQTGASGFLNGSMDDFRIYNTSLTDNEILELYYEYNSLNLIINQSSPTCSDSYTRFQANSSDTPFCSTTSSVMDKSQGGDTVCIADGIYSKKLKLRNKNNGIILKSCSNNDNVILTNSYNEFYNTSDHTWNNISTSSYNIWVSDVTSSFNCLYGFYNSTNKSFYPACEDSTICVNPTCSSSPSMNFTWWNETLPYDSIWHNDTENKVYIKFQDKSINPNNLSLWIGNDFTITLENINYTSTPTIIANFTINSFATGLYIISNSQNVTIENNDFIGCGNKCIQISGNSGNTTIQNNNGVFSRLQNWTWTYEHDIANTFLWLESAKDNIKVLYNTIFGYGNGIVPRYLTASGIPINDFFGLEIGHNVLKDITDDAIEPEDYANCYNIHHNNITNVHVVLTLTPSNSTTCYSNFTDNIGIANMSQDVLSGSTMRVFKFSSGSSSAVGWNILRNTLSGDNGTIQSAVGSGLIRNFTFRDNIIFGETKHILFERTGTPQQGNLYNYNLYYNLLGNFSQYWSNDTNPTIYETLASAKLGGDWDTVWDVNSIQTSPLFLTGTFQPQGTACTMSSTGSFVGAVACETTPPVRTIINPTNNTNLSANTLWTWINITTNEIANCSYNLTDTGYGNMTPFTNTASTTHSFNFSNSSTLENGNTYTLNYRCQDQTLNNNTFSTIHVFGVSNTVTPPVISGRTNSLLRNGVAVMIALAILAAFALPIIAGVDISVGLMITFLLITVIGMIAIQFVFNLT